MKLSILTATYNRAKYLPKLYNSIKENMNCDIEIEWIIVDDGSSDNTKEMVEKFNKEDIIELKYIYQENKGKMAAINKAIEYVTGNICVDCDSDDYFCKESFKIILDNVEKLFKCNYLYGMAFLKQDEHGNISGKKMTEKETTMFDLYFKQDVQGEKIIVYNSEIRKKFAHELEAKEKFITEARMYHKMDEQYKLIPINIPIECGDYIENGYTKNIKKTFFESPNGYYMYFKEILQKDMKEVKLEKRLYVIKHYILFGYMTKRKFNIKNIKNINNKILYFLLYIPGIIKSKKFK